MGPIKATETSAAVDKISANMQLIILFGGNCCHACRAHTGERNRRSGVCLSVCLSRLTYTQHSLTRTGSSQRGLHAFRSVCTRADTLTVSLGPEAGESPTPAREFPAKPCSQLRRRVRSIFHLPPSPSNGRQRRLTADGRRVIASGLRRRRRTSCPHDCFVGRHVENMTFSSR